MQRDARSGAWRFKRYGVMVAQPMVTIASCTNELHGYPTLFDSNFGPFYHLSSQYHKAFHVPPVGVTRGPWTRSSPWCFMVVTFSQDAEAHMAWPEGIRGHTLRAQPEGHRL